MKYLASNVTAYNEYFKWKKNVRFDKKIKPDFLCNMCIDLQLETHFGIRKGVVKDLELFWNVEDCNDPNIDTVAIFDFKNEFVKSNYIIDVNKIFKNLNIETVNISDSIIKVLIFLQSKIALFKRSSKSCS